MLSKANAITWVTMTASNRQLRRAARALGLDPTAPIGDVEIAVLTALNAIPNGTDNSGIDVDNLPALPAAPATGFSQNAKIAVGALAVLVALLLVGVALLIFRGPATVNVTDPVAVAGATALKQTQEAPPATAVVIRETSVVRETVVAMQTVETPVTLVLVKTEVVQTRTPLDTPVPQPTGFQNTGQNVDRHNCPLFADNFMDQREFTTDQPSGQITSPVGTNVGVVWGGNLTVNGTSYGKKIVILSGAGSVNVTGAYRVRWHTLTNSTVADYAAWAECFIEKDEATTYDVVTLVLAAVSGSLDRHGCPLYADDFMNQKEYTTDQPSGLISNPTGTNVGVVWGGNLTVNGTSYGKKIVILSGAGSVNVTGAYRVRWHTLTNSTVADYAAWAECFIEKDENTTYDVVTLALTVPVAQATPLPNTSNPTGLTGQTLDDFYGAFERFTQPSPNSSFTVNTGEWGAVWWKASVNGETFSNCTGVWLKQGTPQVQAAGRIRIWTLPSTVDVVAFKAWWQDKVQIEANGVCKYVWVER